jgi:hypothetical protein
MSKKVWLIDDNPENQVSITKNSKKVWVIEDSPGQVSLTQKSQKNIPTFKQKSKQKSSEQRNPSLAYSLSIIIWGCGQFYNKQWRFGVLFFLLMIMFYALMGITVTFWKSITSSFESVYVNRSATFLILNFFYLLGLIVWLFNAWQAYFRSIKINQKAPKGLKGKLLPVVCSLLIPGWGQLLNGQTKKGLLFGLSLLTGLVALPSIFVTLLAWSTLDASRSRIIIEWIFSISIILSPFFLLMWIVNIFDAAKVSIDHTKKVPLPRRIKYAIKRFRYDIQIYGRKNAVLSRLKRTIVIIILLIIGGTAYHFVPKKFYMQQLQHLGNRMTERDMTVIPDIIRKLPRGSSI